MNTTHLKVLLLLFLLNFALSSSSIEISKSQFQRNNNGNPTSHKPSLESSEDTRLQRPTRAKRDLATMLKGLDDRLYEIEYHMTESNSTIEHLRGFLSAIGFLLQSGDSRNANPCRRSNSRMRPDDNDNTEGTTQDYIQGEQSSPPNGEDDWTLVGSSTCVKIINGLYNYDEAKELCRNEMQIGQDISFPEVVRVDSVEKQNSLLDLLRTHEPLVAGVWVDIISNRESTFGESHSLGSQQGCKELRNGGQNTRVAPGHVPWLNVECVRTNSVMCEKTLPIPYAEIVRKYADRVEVEKKSDIYAHNEHVELNRKIDEINDWKQTRQEQITVDAEQIKLMADQIKYLTIENVARKEGHALLQTQVESLKQRNVELEDWKKVLLESNAETILKIERRQETLLADLSRELNENTGNLFRNLSDSSAQKSANTNLKVESSFRNLSASFAEQLLQSDTKVTGQLGTLTETLTHVRQDTLTTNTATILKLEGRQEALSAKLSQEFNETTGKLYRNLSDTITLKSANTDLKVESSFRNLSASFAEQLLQSESKLTGQLGTVNETLTHSLSHLASLIPPPSTEVEVVNAEHGTIYFTRGTNSQLRRKIWIFQPEGGDSYREMSFMMQKMRLGGNARLSLFDIYKAVQHEWKGSQSSWEKEQVAHGHLVTVTLTIFPGAAETPSFKLKFNTTSTTNSDTYEYTSEVLRREGQQAVSFPSNTESYPPRSLFVAVVAPLSGRSVGLTMKYLDIPDTSPTCANTAFSVYSLDETSSGDLYKPLPLPVDRACRSVGALSEPLVNSSVAILRFFNNGGPVGMGFWVEVN